MARQSKGDAAGANADIAAAKAIQPALAEFFAGYARRRRYGGDRSRSEAATGIGACGGLRARRNALEERRRD
jgi:hypothetical protein